MKKAEVRRMRREAQQGGGRSDSDDPSQQPGETFASNLSRADRALWLMGGRVERRSVPARSVPKLPLVVVRAPEPPELPGPHVVCVAVRLLQLARHLLDDAFSQGASPRDVRIAHRFYRSVKCNSPRLRLGREGQLEPTWCTSSAGEAGEGEAWWGCRYEVGLEPREDAGWGSARWGMRGPWRYSGRERRSRRRRLG